MFRIILIFIFINAYHNLFAEDGFYSDELKPTVSKAFDGTGWVILGSGLALASLLKESDETNQSSLSNDPPFSADTLKHGDFFGTGVPGVIIALTQYQHSESHGKAHLKAIAYTGITTAILKKGFDRKRPSGGDHSMPSGHTSTAFASATSLYYSYGWKWGIPAYMVASLVALQRVSSSSHWPSDTVAGAALGIFWGRATHLKEFNNIQPVVLNNRNLGLAWKNEF